MLPLATTVAPARPDPARSRPRATDPAALLAEWMTTAEPDDLRPRLLRFADGRLAALPVDRWAGPVDTDDETLLQHAVGPVLDVGCGSGALVYALSLAGLPDVSPARERVRVAIAQARSALKGNPRAAGAAHIHRALFDLGETLQRCSTSVESMAVVILDPNATPLADPLRRRTVALLTSLSALFDDLEGEVPHGRQVEVTRQRVDELIDAVDSDQEGGRESRYVAGAVAVSGLRCLEAFVTAQRRSGADATAVPALPAGG